MTVQNIVALNKTCRKMHSRNYASLIYRDFTDGKGIEDVSLLLYTDGALMNTVENRSQIGIVAMLASASRPRKPTNDFNVFNSKKTPIDSQVISAVPIMWKSQKSPRVATSSHAAEIQGLFLGLDTACIMRIFLAEILYGNPLHHVMVDIRNDNTNVIRALHQLGNIGENKRLQTTVEAMKELVNEAAIHTVSWTPGGLNIADEMTKITPANQMHIMCVRNEIRIPTLEYIKSKHQRMHNSKQYLLLREMKKQEQEPELE